MVDCFTIAKPNFALDEASTGRPSTVVIQWAQKGELLIDNSGQFARLPAGPMPNQ